MGAERGGRGGEGGGKGEEGLGCVKKAPENPSLTPGVLRQMQQRRHTFFACRYCSEEASCHEMRSTPSGDIPLRCFLSSWLRQLRQGRAIAEGCPGGGVRRQEAPALAGRGVLLCAAARWRRRCQGQRVCKWLQCWVTVLRLPACKRRLRAAPDPPYLSAYSMTRYTLPLDWLRNASMTETMLSWLDARRSLISRIAR